MFPAELDIARQIGRDRLAEADASALAATFRLARQDRKLHSRLLRAVGQAGSRDHAA